MNLLRYFINRLRHVVIVSAILFFLCPLHSQSDPRLALPITILEGQHGMTNLYNFFTFKDSKDFVWISSYSGLHRFDGKKIKVYKPSEDDSTTINGKWIESYFVEDNTGNIWFGTYRALNCYRRNSDDFISFRVSDEKGSYFVAGEDGLGKIWVRHRNTMFTFDLVTKEFTRIAEVMSGTRRIKLMMNEEGIVQFVLTFSLHPEHPGLQVVDVSDPSNVKDNRYFDQVNRMPSRVRDAIPTTDSIVWVALESGIAKLNIYSSGYELYSPLPAGSLVNFNTIGFERDSIILGGTSKGEFYRFNTGTKKFSYPIEFYDERRKKISIASQGIYQDEEGGVWISFYNSGVGYYHPQNLKFEHYTYDINGFNDPSALLINGLDENSRGSVLVSSQRYGFYELDPINLDLHHLRFKSKKEIPFPPIRIKRTFIDSKGRTWFIAHGSFYVLYPDNSYTRIKQPPLLSITNICELKSGEILISTPKGMFHYPPEADRIQPELTKHDSFDTIEYGFMAVHANGLLYVNSGIDKLLCYDPRNGYKLTNTIPINFQINGITPVPGSDDFLLAANRGPYYYNAVKDSLFLLDWSSLGYDYMIQSIIPVDSHNYILSTDGGVGHLNLQTKTSNAFKTQHGTGATIFNRYAHVQVKDGGVWFGSEKGLTRYNYAELDEDIVPSKVHLVEILINDESIQESTNKNPTKNANILESLSLNYDHNTLSFIFSALDYSGINKAKFEYRLVGFEDDWVDNRGSGLARYANLPYGDYSFEARIKNEPNSTKSLSITILTPFYRKDWFVFCLVTLSLGLIMWYVMWREKQHQIYQNRKLEKQLALEQERVRIATDMHDDIGSGLSSLNMRLSMLAKKADSAEVKNQLRTIAKSSHILSENIREIIWTVNAQNDHLESLMTKLHQYALEFFENYPATCRVDLSENVSSLKISGNHRRELFLTYKEALHNIVKHANADRVNINIHIKGNILFITIKDDGTGFDTGASNSSGTGLRSMLERINRIGGQLTIKSNHLGTDLRIIYSISD